MRKEKAGLRKGRGHRNQSEADEGRKQGTDPTVWSPSVIVFPPPAKIVIGSVTAVGHQGVGDVSVGRETTSPHACSRGPAQGRGGGCLTRQAERPLPWKRI